MKKILLVLLFLPFTFSTGYAQCTPDTTLVGNKIYYAPAGSHTYSVSGQEIIVLPYAYTGLNYDKVLQFRIPEDTTYLGLSADIDYIKVLGVTNLPASFSLNCAPTSNCQFPGGSYGCGQLTGVGGSADSVQLLVAVEIKFSTSAGTGTGTDTLRNIYLVTKGTIGTAEAAPSELTARFYPNPAANTGYLNFTVTDPGKETQIKVTNIVGSVVYSKNFKAETGENKLKFNLSNLSPGIYIYNIKNGAQSRSGRFIVSK